MKNISVEPLPGLITSSSISQPSVQPGLRKCPGLTSSFCIGRNGGSLGGRGRWPGHTVGDWLSLGHNPELRPLCRPPATSSHLPWLLFQAANALIGKIPRPPWNPTAWDIFVNTSFQWHSKLGRKRGCHITCFHVLWWCWDNWFYRSEKTPTTFPHNIYRNSSSYWLLPRLAWVHSPAYPDLTFPNALRSVDLLCFQVKAFPSHPFPPPPPLPPPQPPSGFYVGLADGRQWQRLEGGKSRKVKVFLLFVPQGMFSAVADESPGASASIRLASYSPSSWALEPCHLLLSLCLSSSRSDTQVLLLLVSGLPHWSLWLLNSSSLV